MTGHDDPLLDEPVPAQLGWRLAVGERSRIGGRRTHGTAGVVEVEDLAAIGKAGATRLRMRLHRSVGR